MPLSNELRSTRIDSKQRLHLYATEAAAAAKARDNQVLAYILGRIEDDARHSYSDGERALRDLIAAFLGQPADPHAHENALDELSRLASVPDESA